MDKDELKRRRERLGLKQSNFAKSIGVAPSTVSRYETGSVSIPEWLNLMFEAREARQIKKLQSSVGESK